MIYKIPKNYEIGWYDDLGDSSISYEWGKFFQYNEIDSVVILNKDGFIYLASSANRLHINHLNILINFIINFVANEGGGQLVVKTKELGTEYEREELMISLAKNPTTGYKEWSSIKKLNSEEKTIEWVNNYVSLKIKEFEENTKIKSKNSTPFGLPIDVIFLQIKIKQNEEIIKEMFECYNIIRLDL